MFLKNKSDILPDKLKTMANSFLTMAFDELKKNAFALETNWHIDHLCFRTSSQENYLHTKKQFELFSKLLIESEVNGRLISTFKLPSPIVFQDWEVDLIEVPAPKIGKDTIESFEHFEVVCDLTFEEIKNRYSQCKFDESGLSKDFNQELEVIFGNFALKFHHVSLESVINLESNQQVFSTLKKFNILKVLHPFDPLVAGTFPLNLNVSGSDLDILITVDDLEFVKKFLQDKFGNFSNFKYSEMVIQNEATLLASFTIQEVNFEIFGQKTKSVKQRGYLHFLAEERLLKVGGSSFADKVRAARLQGLKTEPAFANVLGLTNDPFKQLLLIQKQSNQDMKSLVQGIWHSASQK